MISSRKIMLIPVIALFLMACILGGGYWIALDMPSERRTYKIVRYPFPPHIVYKAIRLLEQESSRQEILADVHVAPPDTIIWKLQSPSQQYQALKTFYLEVIPPDSTRLELHDVLYLQAPLYKLAVHWFEPEERELDHLDQEIQNQLNQILQKP